MAILFKTSTTISFEDLETLEQFVKQLPWSPEDHQAVIDGEEVEEEDEVDFDGRKLPATHTFKVLGKDN